MKLHLAGCESHWPLVSELKPRFVLTTFFSFYKSKKNIPLPDCEHLILDSGAFSIQRGKTVEWNHYVDAYIDFIKANPKIDQYVELDIDGVVGLKTVERFREKLESETGRPPIPVWHTCIGHEGWKDLCNSYSYVGIGCINAEHNLDEIYWNRYLTHAHENNVKVHGFGLSANKKLHKYDFDSADSSSWTSGCRYGARYRFEDGQIKLYRNDGYKEGCKPDVKLMNRTNMEEWIKFQNYIYDYKTNQINKSTWW